MRFTSYQTGEFYDELFEGTGRPRSHAQLLIDTIEYELAFGAFGHFANRFAVRRMLESVFEHRHRRAEELLRASVESPV